MKKLVLFSFLLTVVNVFSQTVWYWTNGAGTNKYSDSLNWDDGAFLSGTPIAGDDIFFDPAFTTNNCTIDANTPNLATINIVSGYTGTITVSSGKTITTSGNFSINDGKFVGNDGAITIGGSFFQTAGSFTKSSAAMSIPGNFNLSGGRFYENTSFTNITGACNITGSALYFGTSGAFTVANVTICTGFSTVLSASGATTYIWTPSASLNTNTGATVNATPTLTTTYTVTGTYINRCKNSATPVVKVNPLPAVSITGNLTTCAGTATILTVNGTNAYLWSTNATTQTIAVSASGSLTVTATDVNGCVNSVAATVTVNSLSTASITGNLTTCAGIATNLTANGGNTYVWSTNATTQTILVSTPGSLTVTATDVNGCVDAVAATVTVNSLPTTSITGNLTTCAGTATNLTANGGNTYVWSTNATTQTILVSTQGSLTVMATDVNGCVNSVAATVTVNSLPTASITGNLTTCSGTATNLTANGGNTYVWSNGASTQTITVSSGGSYSLTITDENGCSAHTLAAVTVNILPTLTITPNRNVCEGSAPVPLCAGGASTFMWNPQAGLSAITGACVNATVSSTITYSVTGIDANGCVADAAVVLTFNPLPILSVSGNLIICVGNSTSLTANGADIYSWIPTANLSSATETNAVVSANPSLTTTYSVTGTSSGCSNTVSFVLTVDPCTGIAPLSLGETLGLKLFPNPTGGNLTVAFKLNKQSDVIIKVMDMKGNEIYQETKNQYQGEYQSDIDFSNQAKGIYLINIFTDEAMISRKVIVE